LWGLIWFGIFTISVPSTLFALVLFIQKYFIPKISHSCFDDYSRRLMMATFATVDVVVVIIFFSFVSSVQFLINKFPRALTFMVFPSRTKRIWLMLTHN
jgi:hypothetical protein